MKQSEFLLMDRIQKIQQIDKNFDLRNNAYISFSGGKDSVVLSWLIDKALLNNEIPRVYCNTGIELNEIVKFVKEQQKKDSRIKIISSGVNIRQMLDEKGYPFKSKEHSHKLHLLQQGSKAESILKYFRFIENNDKNHVCPKKLMYQSENNLSFKVSDECCNILKKKPLEKWSKENNREIAILGIRQAEGGQRANVKNCLFYKRDKLKKFSPLLPCPNDFTEFIINEFKLDICELYKPPYNFDRTGCKGCPFSIDIQNELDTLEKYFPNERQQCEHIFGKVYDEYRQLNYRLKK